MWGGGEGRGGGAVGQSSIQTVGLHVRKQRCYERRECFQMAAKIFFKVSYVVRGERRQEGGGGWH